MVATISGVHWSQVDHLRRTASEQADEIRKLRLALAAERHARLTAEMQLAIARGDQAAWAKAMSEREAA